MWEEGKFSPGPGKGGTFCLFIHHCYMDILYSTCLHFSTKIGNFHGRLHVCEGQTQETYQLLPLKEKGQEDSSAPK